MDRSTLPRFFDLRFPPCDMISRRVVRAPRRLISAPAARTGLPVATLDPLRRYPKLSKAIHTVRKIRGVHDVVVRGQITLRWATAIDLLWLAHDVRRAWDSNLS